MLLNTLMLTIYIVLNIYVIWRIGYWIEFAFSFHVMKKKLLKISAAIVCIAASSSLLIWLLFPKNSFSVTLIRIGNYWLGFFIELVTCLIAADVIFAVFWLINKKKRHEYAKEYHKVYGAVVLAVSLMLTIGGCISAGNIHTNVYDITIPGKDVKMEQLKVALIADTHMGYSIGCKQIKDMTEKVNAMNPDVVLIAGDIFDNDYDALDNPEMLSEQFRKLKSKYGVYAVYGNHDVKAKLVGGFTVGGSRRRDRRMEQFLKDSNVTVLKDRSITIADDSIYLVGRLDAQHSGDGKNRKSLKELTKDLNPDKPLFVLDHEPVGLEASAQAGVDVLFSGHTHDNQFFPLNLISRFVWENPHGCRNIDVSNTGTTDKGNADSMYSFVTSGVGVYGPKMRTFTQAEVMEINIHFK